MKDSERKHLEQYEDMRMSLKHLDEVSANQDLSYTEELRREELEMWEMERNTLIEHGREKGKAEGIAEGEAKKQKEIALRLLEAGFTSSDISKATSLSEQEIACISSRVAMSGFMLYFTSS